jgi:hypothetical protein
MWAKMKYICKKFINHQIKKCLLFRWRHAVAIMHTLNWTNQCPLFMTVLHIFEISEDDHPRLVTHARDIWWTLDFPNAFVSPGVNSRVELVPSHGASRRRLGENITRFLAGYYSVIPDVSFSLIKASSSKYRAKYCNLYFEIVAANSNFKPKLTSKVIKHVHSQNSRMKKANISFQNCSIIHKT